MRQRLPLRFKAGHHLLGVHAQLDHLERDPAADRFGLLRDIDHSAAALADFLQQLVAADGHAHRLVGRLGQPGNQGRTAGFGRIGQQAVGGLVRREQRLQPLAEGRVSVTLPVQEEGALGTRELESGLKQTFLTLRGWIHNGIW